MREIQDTPQVLNGSLIDERGDKICTIDDGIVYNIYGCKIAKIGDFGDIYSLDGKNLYIRTENVNGGIRFKTETHPCAAADFMAIVAETETVNS